LVRASDRQLDLTGTAVQIENIGDQHLSVRILELRVPVSQRMDDLNRSLAVRLNCGYISFGVAARPEWRESSDRGVDGTGAGLRPAALRRFGAHKTAHHALCRPGGARAAERILFPRRERRSTIHGVAANDPDKPEGAGNSVRPAGAGVGRIVGCLSHASTGCFDISSGWGGVALPVRGRE
jgi:hypothetical protein